MKDSDLEQTDSLKDSNTFYASSDPNSNQVGSVSFDETNLLLLKKYRDWEETLKLEYYKSNPLRNYVSSTYGQSILPVRSSHRNKKKSLPKIFNGGAVLALKTSMSAVAASAWPYVTPTTAPSR